MRRKRGSGHIEMIGSFLLFFFFVLFMLLILKPYDTHTLSGSVISGMHDRFEEETRVEFSKVFIGINLTSLEELETGCFYINLSEDLFGYGFIDRQSLVWDINSSDPLDITLIDSELNVFESGGNTVNGLYVSKASGVRYYEVLISKEFDSGSADDLCLYIKDFQMGSVIERKLVSQKVLAEMKRKYYDRNGGGYLELADDLGVPRTFDYAIVVTGLPEGGDGSYIMQDVVPDSGEIIAQEYLMEVLYTNSTIYNARFILKVW